MSKNTGHIVKPRMPDLDPAPEPDQDHVNRIHVSIGLVDESQNILLTVPNES